MILSQSSHCVLMLVTCKSHANHMILTPRVPIPARSGPVCWGQWHGLSDRSLALPQRCTAHQPAWGEEDGSVRKEESEKEGRRKGQEKGEEGGRREGIREGIWEGIRERDGGEMERDGGERERDGGGTEEKGRGTEEKGRGTEEKGRGTEEKGRGRRKSGGVGWRRKRRRGPVNG